MRELFTDAAVLAALAAIAAGRLPRLRMNRATIALAAAALLVAAGSIGLEEAFAAIDLGTVCLLLSMMVIVANLRLSGFFEAAGARLLAAARGPQVHGVQWLWRGALNNLLNPKAGIFYVSFLPQFIPQGVAVAPFAILLASLHVLMGLACKNAILIVEFARELELHGKTRLHLDGDSRRPASGSIDRAAQGGAADAGTSDCAIGTTATGWASDVATLAACENWLSMPRAHRPVSRDWKQGLG